MAPIRAESLRAASQAFCDHVNRVLATTITQTRLQVILSPDAPRAQLAFRQGGQPIPARLTTRFGLMGLYLGQVCTADRTPDGLHELRTVEYRYTVTPDGAAEPLLRWEYIRTPGPEDLWCRHHLQGPIHLEFPRDTVSLNDLHLPTGYVPFEDVLRFCIVDLGVRPLSEDWDRILRESYARFKTEFTE